MSWNLALRCGPSRAHRSAIPREHARKARRAIGSRRIGVGLAVPVRHELDRLPGKVRRMRVTFNFRLASFITALVLLAIPRVSAEVHSNPLNISAADAKADVHSHKGMNCATCHASRETQSPKSAAATSAGPIRREKVNQVCGSCHADAV